MKKINKNIPSIEQLDQLRAWCLHLHDTKQAKKYGKVSIKPVPLFNKDTRLNGYIESIDIATGNAFLAGKSLSIGSANKLMYWLETNFPWAFETEEELKQQQKKQWERLVSNAQYQQSFMKFQILGDQGLKCININASQQMAYDNLPKINVKESFYLELSGKPDDQFFIVLESFNDTKTLIQVAPLIPSRLLPPNTFTSIIQRDKETLRYPDKISLQFSEQYGLGIWSCIAIRARSIPIKAKTTESELLITPQELAKFSSRLLQQSDEFAIDRYTFVLGSSKQ